MRRAIAATLAAALLSTGCSALPGFGTDPLNPEGASAVGSTLTPDGGVLTVGEDASITFPEGFVEEDVEVSADTKVYAALPFVTVLAQLNVQHDAPLSAGATIRFPFTQNEYDAANGKLVVLVGEQDGRWTPLPTELDRDAMVMSAEAPHFSSFIKGGLKDLGDLTGKLVDGIAADIERISDELKMVMPERAPTCDPGDKTLTIASTGPKPPALSACAQTRQDGSTLVRVTNRYKIPFTTMSPIPASWTPDVPDLLETDDPFEWLQQQLYGGYNGLLVPTRPDENFDVSTGTARFIVPPGEVTEEIGFIPDPPAVLLNVFFVALSVTGITSAAKVVDGPITQAPRSTSSIVREVKKLTREINKLQKERAETVRLQGGRLAPEEGLILQRQRAELMAKAEFSEAERREGVLERVNEFLLLYGGVTCLQRVAGEVFATGFDPTKVPGGLVAARDKCFYPLIVDAVTSKLGADGVIATPQAIERLLSDVVAGATRSVGVVYSTVRAGVERKGFPRLRLNRNAQDVARVAGAQVIVKPACDSALDAKFVESVRPTDITLKCTDFGVRETEALHGLTWDLWSATSNPVGVGTHTDGREVTLTLFNPLQYANLVPTFRHGLLQYSDGEVAVETYRHAASTFGGPKEAVQYKIDNPGVVDEQDCLSGQNYASYRTEADLITRCGVTDSEVGKVLARHMMPRVFTGCQQAEFRPVAFQGCFGDFGFNVESIQWGSYGAKTASGSAVVSNESGPVRSDSVGNPLSVRFRLLDPVTVDGARVFRIMIVEPDGFNEEAYYLQVSPGEHKDADALFTRVIDAGVDGCLTAADPDEACEVSLVDVRFLRERLPRG